MFISPRPDETDAMLIEAQGSGLPENDEIARGAGNFAVVANMISDEHAAGPHFLAQLAVHRLIHPTYNGFVDMHTHLDGDTASPPLKILRQAVRRGLTGLVVTNHDSTRELEQYRDLIDQYQLNLDLFPGVESTALMPDSLGRLDSSKPKHILALFEPEMLDIGMPDIPCHMPVAELNRLVHAYGGKTSVAHPELSNISMTIPEILEIQSGDDPAGHVDYVEGHQGGVQSLLRLRERNPWITNILLRLGILPDIIDTNVLTRAQFSNAEEIKGMTAGTDAHSTLHIGTVGVRFPKSLGLFNAIETGHSALVQSLRLPKPWRTLDIIRGTLGSKRLEKARKQGVDGFILYDPELHGVLPKVA